MASLLGEIGTIEWCRRTNGILGRGERARFMAASALRTARWLPRMLAARAGLRGSGPDPSALTPPDTATTRNVLEACADLDPMLIEHGYRSYLFGRALGEVEGLDCDPEALFAVGLLHDYGISIMEELTDRCFTLAGAEYADPALAATDLTPELRHDSLDAMTLHFNPSVRRDQGNLQYLAHDGILLDVFGFRSWELDPAGIDRTIERHPRHGFQIRTEAPMRLHARQVKGCRAAPLILGGFALMLPISRWRGLEREAAAAEQAATQQA